MTALFLTADAAAQGGGFDMGSMLWQFGAFALIIVVFYFLLIRPESKRKKEVNKMRSELIVGDEVTTIGGLIGKIVSIKDDEVTVETGSDKIRLKFVRWAISSKNIQSIPEKK